MNKSLILAALLLSALLAPAQETYQYATRNDTTRLMLDVYRPAHQRADRACVVYMFGGGFYLGQRNGEPDVLACSKLADLGFTVVSIDYRLGLRQIDPSDASLFKVSTYFGNAVSMAVQDCSAAIAYICAHADELNIDTAHIVLTGSSAGAITVLQTDYCRANSLPDAKELPPTFRPLAVIPYAGGILCRNRDMKYATPPAPTCFFHGTKDRIVNYKRFPMSFSSSQFGADRVAKIFKKNKFSYWILRYDGIGHEIAGALPKTTEEFTAFVDAVEAGRRMNYDAHCNDSKIVASEWSKRTVIDLYLK
ncbi:MAG: alpha/beta hydrolase [Bacteroidales bacterium]|nr:alpha/beta hydrolase [Bacteroidales bacterium]